MSDPQDLSAFLAEAWQHLGRGVADKRSPARFPTFCTVSADGKPHARTVALRAARQSDAQLEVHTDRDTPKIAHLRHTPFAAFHVWLPRADLQIRLNCTVEILTGESVSDDWQKVPPLSRVSYGTIPIPGTPIPDAFAYDKPAVQERFAVLRCTVSEIDLVHLGQPHRRARYHREDNWKGSWLAP